MRFGLGTDYGGVISGINCICFLDFSAIHICFFICSRIPHSMDVVTNHFVDDSYYILQDESGLVTSNVVTGSEICSTEISVPSTSTVVYSQVCCKYFSRLLCLLNMCDLESNIKPDLLFYRMHFRFPVEY